MLQFLSNMVVNPEVEILNDKTDSHSEDNLESVSLAQRVNKQIMNLFSKYVSEDGKSVDYIGISKSEEYNDFKESSGLLRSIKLSDLEQVERKVLFLNLYNALTIHSYVAKGLPKSATEKLNLMAGVGYQVGKLVYSLNDMEHGILRNNRKPPAFYYLKPLLSEGDPRLKYIVDLDPRIHFALVCGSKGCPPVRIYSEKNIERGLNSATELFLSDPNNFEIKGSVINLSKIFEWYGTDFAADQTGVLNWLKKFLEKEKKEELEQLMEKKAYTIKYITYNWDLNS